MAEYLTWTDAQKKGWEEWVEGRPEVVQALARRFPANRLYLLKPTGQRVFPHAYSEDNTVTVVVSGYFNLVLQERQVFGINPDDLEECDLPPDDESVGSADLSVEEVRAVTGIKHKDVAR